MEKKETETLQLNTEVDRVSGVVTQLQRRQGVRLRMFLSVTLVQF